MVSKYGEEGTLISLVKRTYALPSDTLEHFEREIPAGKRSSVIGQLLREWLDNQERQRLREEVIEGCRKMAAVYLEVEREYHPLEEEVQRALDGQSPMRRRRPRPSRSRGGV
jgi:hypothetical protein